MSYFFEDYELNRKIMDGNEFIDNMIEKDIVKLIREFTDIKNRDNIRAIINLVKRFREMESGKQ